MGQLIFFALLLVLMWVVLILPQQRRVRAHQALVASLGEGDEVMTTSGLYGTIIEIEGDDVRLQVAPDVELRFARGAIARRITGPADDGFDDREGDVDETSEVDGTADEPPPA
jgi:preprotein translocase subunit YajC